VASPSAPPGGRGVQSIETGGRLLSVLAAQAESMMLRDLAAAAGLAPAQAHAYLVSLRKIGLVERAPASARYQLGPFALRLGLARMHVSDPIRLASDGIDALAAEMDMLVSLTVWSNRGPTVVKLREGPSEVPANLQVGRTVPLVASTAGRLFVAYAPPEEVRPLLRRELAAESLPINGAMLTLADLEAGAARVRERGYVATHDKPALGISAISMPVFGADGRIELAVTAMGRSKAVDLAPNSLQIGTLRRFVNGLSARLGFKPAGMEAADFVPALQP